jgi:hypothetical protein
MSTLVELALVHIDVKVKTIGDQNNFKIICLILGLLCSCNIATCSLLLFSADSHKGSTFSHSLQLMLQIENLKRNTEWIRSGKQRGGFSCETFPFEILKS